MRITREEVYAGVAELFAKRSTCGRLQVGCVAVKDGRIICTGYNGALEGERDYDGNCKCDLTKPCEKAIHAEANLISYAARNGIALDSSWLYVTHSPCIKCAELIIQSGIAKVFYGIEFRDAKGLNYLRENNIYVNPYGVHK